MSSGVFDMSRRWLSRFNSCLDLLYELLQYGLSLSAGLQSSSMGKASQLPHPVDKQITSMYAVLTHN